MTQYGKTLPSGTGTWLAVVLTFLCPVSGQSADTPALAAPGTISAPAGAQQGTALSLDEVVRIALENHSSVKSAEYQIGAQDAVVHQQMSAYYPTVDFNNSYRTSGSSGGSSGGSKGATGPTGPGGGSSGGSNAFDTVSSAVDVTMTLYNFGKREGSVQSAKDTLDATRYGYNATANNIVLAVKQAYYGVLQADALVRVNQETVKDRAALLRQTRGFYDVGTKPKSDVTLAEANLYLAQANLIVSQNSVDTSWASLRNAMGVDDFAKQPLAEELSVMPFSMTLEDARRAAFDARPELRQFEALLKAQDQLIAVARRNHLPELIFDASYGRRGVSNETESRGGDCTLRVATFPPPAPTDPPDPGVCIRQKTLNTHLNTFPLQPTWAVQLSLNIPIFNGFLTTNQVQQALYNYRSIKEQERVERQQVALQVEQNYLNLSASREVVLANEAAVKAAKENLDLHEGRYQVGYASIIEVSNAQITYTVAQTTYVNAVIANKLAMAQLVNAIGRQ